MKRKRNNRMNMKNADHTAKKEEIFMAENEAMKLQMSLNSDKM